MTQRSREPHSNLAFLQGGGEMGARMRELDWSRTPLGPPETWPQSLRSTVSMLLPSRAQIILFWGSEFTVFYNDAYRPVFGAKHPRALGLPGGEAWSEIWEGMLQELLAGVVRTGEAFWAKDLLFEVERYGYLEETYFDVSYDPVRVESGAVGGVNCIVTETTERVVGERRLALLKDLAERNATARTEHDACALAIETLAAKPQDVLFALAHLDTELQSCTPSAQEQLASTADELVKELVISSSSTGSRAGKLVVGLNPRRPFDGQYRAFLDLVADQLGTALANARAYENERKRAEALAEIDRAKTVFFSNVSHEFRTPLTLMLGPLRDALDDARLPTANRQQLDLAQRNAERLLKLVNTLLDFSRIEAGRVDASYQPTDLAALTTELASVFRSAVEQAGLMFRVECPPLAEPIYVDRDMWEKVVLNLLSNALKFTFEGEIAVRLQGQGDRVDLIVADTGIGIAHDDLPRIFDRFSRIRGSRSRTHEGSGIGLSLVQELVRQHGGDITVESLVNAGTTFRVSIPSGHHHLPPDRVEASHAPAAVGAGTRAYVAEAMGWLNTATAPLPLEEAEAEAVGALPDGGVTARQADQRVVVVDDNADMRDYVSRLLRRRWEVDVYADGFEALQGIRKCRPDLVLTDVMMPRVDGFELLHEIRADDRLCHLPVILLSARAGEEARVQGMEAGADDYLVKPFSARELLARVGAHFEIARVRRDGERTLRESEARHRLLVEQAVDGIFVANTEGRYVSVNQAGCDMLGMTREEVLNSSLIDVLVPEEHHRIGAEVARFADGSIARSEWRFRRKDGSVFIGEVVGRKLPDGQLQGIVRDITERKRAEEALREGEQRFRTLADTAPALLWITEPDASCSFLSRGWYDFTGQTPETGLGFGWLDAVHPDDRARSGEIFRAANQKHEAFALEYRLRGADGAYRWAIDAGRPRFAANAAFLGFIGSVTDIHDRKRSEDALAAEKQILERVAAGTPLAEVLGMLTRMCESQSTDGMLCSVLLLDEAGDRLRHGAAPSLPDEYNQAIDGIRIGPGVGSCGTAAYDQRTVCVTDIAKDPLWTDFRELAATHGLAACCSQPIVSSRGGVLGTVAMYYRRPHDPSAHDRQLIQSAAHLAGIVIERAGAEEQLRRLLEAEQHARTESERLSRMKDEFLTTLSHELRTPLNAILGWSQIIKGGAAASDSIGRGLETIERNARLQAQMIEDLLDVSRITSGKVRLDVQRVRLCPIIEVALDSIRPAADAKAIRIQSLLDCETDQVNGDPARLQQVTWNLLSNAVKFTEKGGRIQVLLERVNSHVELSVSDNGRGIAPDFLPYVFDRFRQADQSTTRKFGGLGLGLSIVKNLIELHGGSVRAKSAGEGQGSTFIVTLPLSLDRRPSGQSVNDVLGQPLIDALSSAEDDQSILAGVAVLYVDDEPDARELVERILAERGARVVTAESASQARRLLPEVRPDVLIADIGMPDEDGYSLIRSVRALPAEQGGTIPAAAVTAMARSEDRRRALMAGFQTHVAKPVEVMELVAVVASLAGRTGR